jgi:hypothetical protein
VKSRDLADFRLGSRLHTIFSTNKSVSMAFLELDGRACCDALMSTCFSVSY